MRAWNMGDSKLSYSAPLNTSAFLFFFFLFFFRVAMGCTCDLRLSPHGRLAQPRRHPGRGGSGPGSGPFGVSRLLG